MGLVSRQPTLPWLFLKFVSQKTWEEHKKWDREATADNQDPCLPLHLTWPGCLLTITTPAPPTHGLPTQHLAASPLALGPQ